MDLNYSLLNQESENTPILILHGLFGSQKNWGAIARKLSGKYTVISIDLRNHGQSPHTETMSYPEMAEDIIQLLDNLGYKSVNILGHSMGGKVAMSCALEYPDRVNLLCVADISPVTYLPRFDQIISALKTLPLDQINNRSNADQLLAKTIDQPSLRQFFLQNLLKENDRYNWRINLNAIEKAMPTLSGFPDYSDDQLFNKQTLFLRGENSDYILPEHHSMIKKHFPKAEIQTIPNSGHWLHAEQPELFYQSLIDFLDENLN
ncbi:MAG: alpha/beta fold hydrolase [Gammaproteobacteria bacterium]